MSSIYQKRVSVSRGRKANYRKQVIKEPERHLRLPYYGEKIVELLAYYNLTQDELSAKSGASQQAISAWVNKDSCPRDATIRAVALSLTPRCPFWWLTGGPETGPLKDAIEKEKQGAALPVSAADSAELHRQLEEGERLRKEIGEKYPNQVLAVNVQQVPLQDLQRAPVVWLPLVDEELAANPGGSSITIDTLTLRSAQMLPVLKEHIRGNAQRCLLRVKNDSMENRYYEGDIVMVKLQHRDLKELRGKDVAAWVPDIEAGMLKVLHEHAGRSEWLLTSVNWKYPPVPVPKKQHGFYAFEVERIVYPSDKRVTN